MDFLRKLWAALTQGWEQEYDPEIQYIPLPPLKTAPMPPTAPLPPKPLPMNPDTLLPWNTTSSLSHENYHNVRVICDLVGLTYAQKEILTACVWQESDFMTNPRPNQNKTLSGKVWSTDYGIVQVNDYYNIGTGKPFPNVQYVLNNPEACVRWMAGIMKSTGKLQPWASYTTGAYKKYLGKTL
jgi:hypothetical protein